MNLNHIEISMFANCVSTLGRTVDALAIINAIKQGRWREQVARIRHHYNSEPKRTGSHEKAKKAVEHLKKNLPGVTWSGTFSRRGNEYLLQHSGLLPADLDMDALDGKDLKEVRAKLRTSPHVFADFISPTGSGLKVIFKVSDDKQKHPGSFLAAQKHILELTGVAIDESSKDLARLCFVSFDSDAYINLDAQEITPRLVVKTPPAAAPSAGYDSKRSKEEIREMLSFIPKRPKYHDWFRIAAAVRDAVDSDEEAIALLKEWSPEEEQGEYAAKLKSGFTEIHIGTLIHLAKAHGWTPPGPYTPAGSNRTRKGSMQPPIGESDNETIRRLAALSLLEYDRIRKDEAKKLGCRESTLELLVNDRRLLLQPPSETSGLQGTAVKLADVEPWPEPVNGAEILDAIAKRFEHYVVLPEGAADMLPLWCAHTHMYKLFQKSPRLNISAPTEICGKSTLRDCVSLFCARAVRTDNMTTPVMFRLVSGHSPTILADECDKWLFTNEELLGLVQSGHEKGGTVMRCEGDSNELRKFGCYAPFVLAAIGALPSQLHSRSIGIRLKRARKEEIKKRLRFDFEHVEYETELNRKLCRWITDNRERIQSCDPKLPEYLFNRIADNWRALFKIAQAAGGDWPQRCASALVKLTTLEDERESLRVILLTDIQKIFAGTWPPLNEGAEPSPIGRIFSCDLVKKLAEMAERPWPEMSKGKPITQVWLARNLGVFDIRSGNIRIDDKQAKGYEAEAFKDAFDRYVMPQKAGTPLFKRPTVPMLGKKAKFYPSQTMNLGRIEKVLRT